MTQEEKQLLIKDLCARLPYNVVVRCTDSDTDYNCFLMTDILNEIQNGYEYYDYKPYLRPMSSMTEEEKEEIRQRFCYEWEESIPELMYYSIEIGDADCLIDWFLEHHFDYRGLIEKGLALEAPEGMY